MDQAYRGTRLDWRKNGKLKNLKKPIIKFFNDRQRTTILKNLEIAEILQNENKNLSLLQVREARDYFSKELEDLINVGECESHPWSNIQFWSSFHRKRCITSRLTSENGINSLEMP